MSQRITFSLFLALALFALSPLSVVAATAASDKTQRLELPGGPGAPFPYTIDVPKGWTARQVLNDPGLWIGPADATPNKDPRFVYVRISTVGLTEPAKTAAAIRENDARDDKWKALAVEVREAQGTSGVWVEIERGEGDAKRQSLTYKLPLPKTSVDFVFTATVADFAKYRAEFEGYLKSIRPNPKATAAAATAKPKPSGN